MNDDLLEKYRYRTALILACRQLSENSEQAGAMEEQLLRQADEVIEKIPLRVIQAVDAQEKARRQ